MAIKQGIIVTNPVDGAELPRVEQHEITPLTDEDIPLFLSAIDNSPMRNAYALCLFAGLREGECLGLSWGQVDFEKGRITISQQLQKEKNKNAKYYIAQYTKSDRPHDLRHPNVKPRTQTFSTFFEIFQGRTLRSYLGRFYHDASIQKSFIFQTIST